MRCNSHATRSSRHSEIAKANHDVSEPPASAPALREPLARCEPLKGDASIAAATPQAILDALPVSAVIVDGAGRIMLANPRGHSDLADGTLDVRHVLERPADSASVTVHPLPAGADGGACTLVLRSDPLASIASRIMQAAALWNLTAHQAKVLGLLVHGEPNKTIATARGCALRTVEVHVTSILKKSRTIRRAELIARFWTMR